MAATPTVRRIFSEVKQLDRDDQLTLLQQIAGFLKKENSVQKAPSLTELSGLGSELWNTTTDIDHYLEEERQW